MHTLGEGVEEALRVAGLVRILSMDRPKRACTSRSG